MVKKFFFIIVVITMSSLTANGALSIYDIQYTTNEDGSSNYDTQIVDCQGGIVIHKSGGGRQRIVLYDPNYPDGWGGILVKGEIDTTPFDDVNLGDWVALESVTVYEWLNKSRGNTILYLDDTSTVSVLSTGNTLPEPLVVGVGEIAAPIEGVDEWVVENHNSEIYEGMFVKVMDVNVLDTGYGKAYDNYILQSNIDANLTCWASDYMNEDIGEIYHPYVEIGQKFCGVAGIIEQYTGEKDGIYYDYYQLLTTTTADFTIEQTGDFNSDCDVDFGDYAAFSIYWLSNFCGEPDWCGGADFAESRNGSVDANDLNVFTDNWLVGTK